MSNQNIVNVGDRVKLVGPDWYENEGKIAKVITVYGDQTLYVSLEGDNAEYSVLAGEYQVVESANDPVNHPSHYTQYPVEVIELTEHMPFLEGNVVKYVARAPYKGNKVQDLEKAEFYLRRAIKKAKAENE